MSGAAQYFSQSYDDARRRFLEVAKAADVAVNHHVHPLTGPGGGTLATDVARVGPRDAKRILGIGSGTHGVEGYCGSGVQTTLLTEGFGKDLPPDTAIVFIHAINHSI